ncbi:MAG: hypothetical protein NZ777_20200 [Pseudomonadales bacterium]|nr:hypothetical protein [Pseudomonadales bacterium]
MLKNLGKWLDQLGEKHREVICRRYGLRGYDKATLIEVAKQLGVICERRIRRIQMEVLRKLRDILEKGGSSCNAIFHWWPRKMLPLFSQMGWRWTTLNWRLKYPQSGFNNSAEEVLDQTRSY